MLLKKCVALKPGLLGGAGFIPDLLRFPPPAEGGGRQGKQITQIAAIHKHVGGKAFDAIGAVDLHRLEATLLAVNLFQPAVGTPVQPGLSRHPALQDPFGCLRPVSETTHPVVVEPARLLQLQLPQKGAPDPGLPTGQFMAIRGTDSC